MQTAAGRRPDRPVARVFCSRFSVYSPKTALDEEFLLQVKDAGVLDETDRSAGAKTMTFFTPGLTTADLDGKPFQPAPGMTYRFDALFLSGERFELRCAEPGMLVADERGLTVDLVPQRRR